MRYFSIHSSRNIISFVQLTVLLLMSVCIQNGLVADDTVPLQVMDWNAAAASWEKSGDFVNAHAEYAKIYQGFPNTPYGLDAAIKTAHLHVRQKQFEQLQPLAEQICRNFSEQPGVFGAVSKLVKDCMYANAYSAAEIISLEVYNQLTSNSRVTLAIGWRGMVYAHQGNDEMAEQMKDLLLSKPDAVASDILDGMCDIGWGYFCAGRLDKALATYRLGLTQNPSHPNAVYLQYHIIKSLLVKKDTSAARMEMETLLTEYASRSKTPGLALRLAKEARHEGLAEWALSVYEILLERFPDHPQVPAVRDAIVETYADMGDLTRACEALQADIKNCPHRRELLRMITRVAVEVARIGETDTAMQLVDEIFSQNPQGTDQQLFGYTTKARVLVHQGKYAEALAEVNNALELFRTDPDALSYHLFGVGEEYYLKGLHELNNPSRVYEARFNFDKAIYIWRTITDALPENTPKANILYHTGMAYWYKESHLDALDAFLRLNAEAPEYKNISQALALSAQCYRKLHENELISTEESEEGLEVILSRLLAIGDTDTIQENVWQLAQMKYERQKWADAIKYLKLCQDYVISDPQKINQLDYQIAQAYESIGNNQMAARHYVDYLDKCRADDIEHLADIQKKIQQLQHD